MSTLDEHGMLDRLPFTPEMRRYCGGTFQVFKRTEKVCFEGYGLRRVRDAVCLKGVHCDGGWHGGCDRLCLLIWKEAWLKRQTDTSTAEVGQMKMPDALRCEVSPGIYRCQATALCEAGDEVPLWEAGQYWRDLKYGNLSPRQFLRMANVLVRNRIRRRLGLPDLGTMVGVRKNTPSEALHLRPGELVEVKSRSEVQETLDKDGKNHGLLFCPEMSRFCGKQFVVLKRVERMIDERTGRLHRVENTVLLDGVMCDGISHRGCGRHSYYFCREAWLKRISP